MLKINTSSATRTVVVYDYQYTMMTCVLQKVKLITFLVGNQRNVTMAAYGKSIDGIYPAVASLCSVVFSVVLNIVAKLIHTQT